MVQGHNKGPGVAKEGEEAATALPERQGPATAGNVVHRFQGCLLGQSGVGAHVVVDFVGGIGGA